MSETGFLLVDKPKGFTSHDVVAVVRRSLGERRVGHAGTLDPAATGLLILGIGRATRLLTFLVGADKRYEAVVRLGISTTTDDAEGEVLQQRGTSGISEEQIVVAAEQFQGAIEQRPSSVSAVKVAGKRAYQRVLDGEIVELPTRSVVVHQLDIESVSESKPAVGTMDAHQDEIGTVDEVPATIDVRIRTHVSSGTYIRALARDMGEILGCGGHLVELRRTSVGPFGVAEAFGGLHALSNRNSANGSASTDINKDELVRRLKDSLLSPESVANRAWPVVVLDDESTAVVQYGQRIPATGDPRGPTALCSASGRLLAIVEADEGLWRYRVVLAAPGRKIPVNG